jgi:hypothetical protein
MKLLPDFKEFIGALQSEGVKFLVVGAHALAAFGHPRYTGDLDIWVERSEDNALRVERALEKFGMGSLGLGSKDFLQPRMCFQLGYAPARIDILTDISGLDFTAAYARRESLQVSELAIPCIGREDFITNKRAAGRPKDLVDIDSITLKKESNA